MKTTGKVTGIVSNLVTVEVNGPVAENELCYITLGDTKLLAEVIKVKGRYASVQVFESTRGLKNGDAVEFEGRMLEVTLGPGLMSSVYDGLQNNLATMEGVFLKRGEYTQPLDHDRLWDFTPIAKAGDKVIAADWLGEVKEGWLPHKIMVPFSFKGEYTVKSVAEAGQYRPYRSGTHQCRRRGRERDNGSEMACQGSNQELCREAKAEQDNGDRSQGNRHPQPYRRGRYRLHPGTFRMRKDRAPARHRQAG